jgi:hypothetical protein
MSWMKINPAQGDGPRSLIQSARPSTVHTRSGQVGSPVRDDLDNVDQQRWAVVVYLLIV